MKSSAWQAVSDLITAPEMTIDVGGRLTRVKGSCLLAQLEEAVTEGMERGTGGGRGGTRMPVSAEALDLLMEIDYAARSGAAAFGLSRHDPGNSPIPWTGRLLRHVLATAEAAGMTHVVDRIETKALGWKIAIVELLGDGTGPTPAGRRAVRGAACGTCGQSTVLDYDRDGAATRRPAIVLVTDAGGWWIVCQACGDQRRPAVPGEPELIYSTEVPKWT